MGKTLTSILTIAAAVAVNVIPGVGQFLSAAIGSTLATAAITAVTVAGLQSAVGLLGLGGSPKPETTETAIKTPRPPRVAAYGRSRLYGAYILFETASNGTAVDVYAVADGKCDGQELFYLNDDTVVVGGGGIVATGTDGRYRDGAVSLYSTDGSIPGAGFPAVTALLPGIWTANHRGDGVVAMALTAKSVRANEYQETYPTSSVPLPSMVARWQLCPDPEAADPLDETGWTWTENPVRQLLHYKLTREGPRPALPRSDAGYDAEMAALRLAWWNRKIAPTLDYWIAAAADCDSARALKAGGTEPKYRSSVAHKLTDKHQGPIAALLATFDGWLMPRADGALVVYSGKYYAPTVAIGSDEIVSYTYDAGPPDEGEAVNEIIVSYISSAHNYNTVEADAWRDETDIARRGQVLSTPLEVQIPSHAQGRFLAKRLMQRRSAQHRGSVTTNIAGRGVLGERFITLHLEEAGTVFYSGPAEILGARRTLRGGVSFEWVAADANVDNWNPALEEGEPAAKGNRVASQPLDTPTIESATVTYVSGEAYAEIEAQGPARDDLQWYVRFRQVGAGVWGAEAEYSDTAPGADVVLTAGPLPTGTDVELQVAYRVGDGRYSGWSVAEPVATTAPLDFDGGVLPAGVTYAGNAGKGTRFNSAGVLVASVADTPRFDYNPVGLAPLGVLVEPAATNRLLHSAAFDDAAWTKTNLAVAANAVAGPDGAASADTLTRTSDAANCWLRQAAAGAIGTVQSVAVFAKAAGVGDQLGLRLVSTLPDRADAVFDLVAGTVVGTAATSYTGVSASITPVGGGWYLCVLTATVGGTAMTYVYAGPTDASRAVNAWFSASAGVFSSIHAVGAQLEADAATTYVPTGAAAETRTADALTVADLDAGNYRLTFGDATTLDIAHGGGNYMIPTAARRRIASVEKLP